MEEYRHHIRHEANSNLRKHELSWCGKYIGGTFFFQNIDHAALHMQQEGRLLPCEECKKAIMEALNAPELKKL